MDATNISFTMKGSATKDEVRKNLTPNRKTEFMNMDTTDII